MPDEVSIHSKQIAITSIAAVTPQFADIGTLFHAWCSGTPARNESANEVDFPTLARLAITQVLALDTEATPQNRGLLLATTKGDIAGQIRWMRDADAGVAQAEPPTLNTALQMIRDPNIFGGPSYVISTACTSGLVALIESAILVADGEADAMVALGADAAGDFVRDGFHALRAISPTACRPFDQNRDGLTLGSAAAGCTVQRRGSIAPLCTISGWGISNDAAHMTAPDRNAGGLIRAIQQALTMASVRPSDIGVIFAHGTGTKYNDAMESVAIENIFLANNWFPAVTAVKGLIGHTLGAAGLIEAALAVEMLRTQTIPAITGLRSPEFRADFVMTTRKTSFRHVLKIASGFGGMNSAVILSQPEH